MSIKKVATLTIAALILGVALGSFGIAGAVDSATPACGVNGAACGTAACQTACQPTAMDCGTGVCGAGGSCGMRGGAPESPWVRTP